MGTDSAEVFSRIYREREWGSEESVSGRGSELRNTAQLIRELPGLFKRLAIESVLDVPCGDFNWMRHVDLQGVRYIGGDIVGDVVDKNKDLYQSNDRSFFRLDLLNDPLPFCDLIICRDCLFHFSRADVFKALRQFVDSGANYLLTTTFTYRTYPRNGDIATGQWTPINLELSPYSLEPPSTLLIEGSNESIDYGPEIGIVPMWDRCLGLWRMESICKRLQEGQV